MKYLSCDLRALGLMRILVAVVILIDLSIRISDLEAFYTNSGAVPLTMMFAHMWNKYYISLHAISGLWQVQVALFMFSAFCAVMLFIGYRTRLFTVLSWVMLLSLHNRNSLILQGGDDLLRMVLFWGMFIPWGARYSCDKLLNIQRDFFVDIKTIFTVATVAYILQICYIYSGSALLKGPEWHTNFTALYYAYSLDQIAYPLTKCYYYYPELLKKLTAVAYYFELLVPLLFFIPFKHAQFRLLGVISIIVFHLFNSMHLLIGMFPIIGICTVVGILPSFAIDRLELWFSSIKLKIAQSFLGWSAFIAYLINWKTPVYVHSRWKESVTTAMLIFLIFFVFDWNFSNISVIKSKLSNNLRFIGYGLRLDQNWGMFAPGVFKDDGWYVLEGTTDDGKNVNVLNPGTPISYNKPESVVSMFKNDRWRKYSENFIFTYNEYMRGYFCSYYKRVWNEKNKNQKLKNLRIVYVNELTKPDYQYTTPNKVTLWQCGN